MTEPIGETARAYAADALLRATVELIEKYGHSVTGVGAGPRGPQFAYTTGLTAQGRPELVIAGLDPRDMTAILNTVAARGLLQHDASLGGVLGGGLRARIRAGAPTDALYPGAAYRLYGEGRVTTLHQVLWPDEAGLYPGEPGFTLAQLQPLVER